MKIEYYKHNLTAEDRRECMNVLKSLFLTTGSVVGEFEEKFAKYMKAKYCVGLMSCTDALFLALKYFGIQKGDEVITTPQSFLSTSNAIEYCGAKPVFVDVEESTGNINADLIEKAITKNTKAIIAVHLFGQMCDMRKIRRIANKYKLKVIEDAAHCIEGERDGVRVGQLGDMACFSFYAVKNITSGEGGAITCNSAKAYQWLKQARLHGMSKSAADRYKKYEHWDMEFLGYKMNMNNIQASLLLHQLDRVDALLLKKEKIAERYNRGFAENKNISKPDVLPKTKHARFFYSIWVNPKLRDKLIRDLQAAGIGVAVHFIPIHLMKYYKDKYGYKKGDFPVAEKIGGSTLSLPFYPKLRNIEINYVINTVNKLTR